MRRCNPPAPSTCISARETLQTNQRILIARPSWESPPSSLMVGCHDKSQPISSLGESRLPGGVSITEVRPEVGERAHSNVSDSSRVGETCWETCGHPGGTFCHSTDVQRRSGLIIRWRSAACLSKQTKLQVPTKALPATERQVKGKHDTCCCFSISLLLMNGSAG